jgi:hypothetical protein
MAQVTISEEHYRELVARAHARGTTPDALADALLGHADDWIAASLRTISGALARGDTQAARDELESVLETLEILDDPEAMAAIEDDLAAQARGEAIEGVPWEHFKTEHGW